VRDELLAAGVVALLRGAALQFGLQVGLQAVQAVEVQALGELVVQVLQLLGLHVQDLHADGVRGVLVVAVLVGRNVDLHGVAGVLAEQRVTHVRFGDVQVDGVRAAVLALLLHGHLVAGLDGAFGALEAGVALLQVAQGAVQDVVGDLGRGGFQLQAAPVRQGHFGVRLARHVEGEVLAAHDLGRVDGGVHEAEVQLAGGLGVVHLQQAVADLALHVALADAALDDLLGGLAGAESGDAHVAAQTGPHLIVGAVHFGGGHRDFKFDFVAFSADQLCHVTSPVPAATPVLPWGRSRPRVCVALPGPPG